MYRQVKKVGTERVQTRHKSDKAEGSSYKRFLSQCFTKLWWVQQLGWEHVQKKKGTCSGKFLKRCVFCVLCALWVCFIMFQKSFEGERLQLLFLQRFLKYKSPKNACSHVSFVTALATRHHHSSDSRNYAHRVDQKG